jgi:hypothetical protein
MNDSTTKSSAEREEPDRAAADDGMIERGPHAGELDGDLDEQGRAMAAADEAAGDEVFYPADPRMLAAEAAEAAAMPGPSTTGYYDEMMAARAAEAGPLPDGAAAMTDDPAPVFGPRPPVTENQASMRYGVGTHDAIERYSALSLRHGLANAEASLKARGEWDEAKFGKGGEQPLTTDEHLELLATAEYLHRSYQPTGVQMGRALNAGADWLAVAQAVGTTEADARGQYRKWAEGQHDMWAGTGVWAGDPSWAPHRFGLSDADYAAALARSVDDVTYPGGIGDPDTIGTQPAPEFGRVHDEAGRPVAYLGDPGPVEAEARANREADRATQEEGTARLDDSPGLRQLLAHQLGEADAREAGE